MNSAKIGAVPSKWKPTPQNIFKRSYDTVRMIWRGYLVYRKPRFKSWLSHNLTENKLQSRTGTHAFLLWRKLVPTKLYLHIAKPCRNTNSKTGICICKTRALRMNMFITTQENIGKNWFTEGWWIINVNMFFTS